MRIQDLSRLVLRNLLRSPLRTGLTLLGVSLSVLLFTGIEAFAAGLTEALQSGDKARTLLVYRQNRYCPQTSFLPERYAEEIAAIDGVSGVLPVKVFLNNCRTNLDMVTFQGAPVDLLLKNRDLELVAGSIEAFRAEGDAALVGEAFARRRGLKIGEKFRFGEILVKVAGIYRSKDAVLESLVLTHLEFLQRAAPVQRLGTVTQFEVKIDDPARREEIAAAIDERLKNREEPTQTWMMAQFLARATQELSQILRFGRLFGLACVLVVVVLLANTITLSLQERRREMGVLRAIGFQGVHLSALVVMESLGLAFIGATLGFLLCWSVLGSSQLGIGVEGVTVRFRLEPSVVLLSFGIAMGASLIASLSEAHAAAKRPVVSALRGSA